MTKIKTAMPSQGSLPFTFPSTPVAMQQGLFLTFGTSCSGGIPAQADCADALWLIQVMVWMVQWVIYNNLGIMYYFQRSSRIQRLQTPLCMWYNYIIFQCFRRRLIKALRGPGEELFVSLCKLSGRFTSGPLPWPSPNFETSPDRQSPTLDMKSCTWRYMETSKALCRQSVGLHFGANGRCSQR